MKTYKDIENLIGNLKHEFLLTVDLSDFGSHPKYGKYKKWSYGVCGDDECGLRNFHEVYFDTNTEYECYEPIYRLEPEVVDKIYYKVREELVKQGEIEIKEDKVVKPVFE